MIYGGTSGYMKLSRVLHFDAMSSSPPEVFFPPQIISCQGQL